MKENPVKGEFDLEFIELNSCVWIIKSRLYFFNSFPTTAIHH